MKPVWQNKIANCLSACVASILELPIADVPTFYSEEAFIKGLQAGGSYSPQIATQVDWNLEQWLYGKGYISLRTMQVPPIPHIKCLVWKDWKGAHAVIGKGRDVI